MFQSMAPFRVVSMSLLVALASVAACRPGVPQQQSGGGGSSTRTYCDANGACTSTGILGSITTAGY